MTTSKTGWPPYCGVHFPVERTAGVPIVCTKPVHGSHERHYNDELGWGWW